MKQNNLPLFIDMELDSFLPTGWRLVAPESGAWNRKGSEWTVKVVDGANMDWDLTIRARACLEENIAPRVVIDLSQRVVDTADSLLDLLPLPGKL